MSVFLAGADPRRMSHCPACASRRFQGVRFPSFLGDGCKDCGWSVA